ncbi:type III restriction/modification system, modification subunit [Arcobacter acticola]|uniref:site-specific DNA-methyltransferase (adenine-specific) n=1 Tax=Arcobacter acticola TaxID=1849015 RepID=A0A6M8EUR1_9BACT|nr:site-specific DNA-methyltransferase [Arcobacter acticola]QKE28265.1 type III restriction/modification system, modification subunit [Arcobacter acticola]
MTKLDGKSMDIVSDNIEKLKEIFPEVFSEGKLQFEKLEEELGKFSDKENERYNFTWNGKSESKKIALTPSTGTLRPCEEESKNFDTTQNLYIEGDNLEVLKLLQKSYHKKIKMIYIDPPYNTGKDFVYKDNFKDNIQNYLEQTGQVDSEGNKLSTNSETSGRYHSDWLNMIYPRLKLARNLLKDDGVIFISIDDNEVTNLRKVCDEIFGEDNFISLLSVENNPKGRKNSKFISVSNEFCLVYSKNKEYSCFIENIPKNIKDMKEDEDGNFVHNSGKRVLVGKNDFNKVVQNFNSEKHYTVYYSKTSSEIIFKKEQNIDIVDDGLIKNGYIRYISFNENMNFVENTYTQSKIKLLFEDNALEFKDDKIFEKNFNSTIRMKSLIVNRTYDALVNKKKIIDYKIDVKTTSAGTYLKDLFQTKESLFTAPKSIGLIELFLTLFEENDCIVLDFFSGSATTAHSVMKLNSEDNGNRKFICVQLPEETDEKSEAYKNGYKNICEIGKERIRRAGEKILEENSDKDLSELDIGFKVLKLDSSNIKKWDSDFDNVEKTLEDMVDNIKSDRTEEDLVYEILLKYGLDLTLPIETLKINDKTIYSIGYGSLVCCLDKNIDTDTVEKISELKTKFEEDYGLETIRVVFKDSSFKDSIVKTNSLQILKQNGIEEVVSI